MVFFINEVIPVLLVPASLGQAGLEVHPFMPLECYLGP